MKILILSANTGGGHNSAAAALQEVFTEKGITFDVRDALAFVSEFHSDLISNGHVYLYRYLPKLFGVGYRFEERHHPRLLYDQMALGAKRFARFVARNGYDAVVSTHIFGSMMATEARKKYGFSLPHYLIVTDYCMYPGMDMIDVDRFFIAAEDLAPLYIASGVQSDRLCPSGIPIRQRFISPMDKLEARRSLRLKEEGRVVLLFSGSIGCGHLTHVVPRLERMLPEDAKLVVICGNNRRLAERLRDRCGEKCRVIGFTKRVADYMVASDLCISKPGGLSTTEMMAMKLPMLLMLSVPGCETHNLNYFIQHGVAVGTDTWEEAIRLCGELLSEPDRLDHMRQNYRKVSYAGGAERVASAIMEDFENRK